MNQLPGSFFAAGAMTALNPVGGIIFGATELVTGLLVSRGNYPIENGDPLKSKVYKIIVPMVMGIGAGLAAVALAGYTLTTAMVVSLAVGTVAYTALLTLTLFALGTIYCGASAIWDGIQACCNC